MLEEVLFLQNVVVIYFKDHNIYKEFRVEEKEDFGKFKVIELTLHS